MDSKSLSNILINKKSLTQIGNFPFFSDFRISITSYIPMGQILKLQPKNTPQNHPYLYSSGKRNPVMIILSANIFPVLGMTCQCNVKLNSFPRRLLPYNSKKIKDLAWFEEVVVKINFQKWLYLISESVLVCGMNPEFRMLFWRYNTIPERNLSHDNFKINTSNEHPFFFFAWEWRRFEKMD